MVVVLQALLDRHAMLRLRVETTAPGWSLSGARAGFGRRAHVPAHGGRRCRMRRYGGAVAVEPGRRGDAQRAVGGAHRSAGGGRSPPGRRRRCRGEFCWRTSTSPGPSTAAGNRWRCRAAGMSFARWASLLAEHARDPEVVAQAQAWRQVAGDPAFLPAVQPAVDTLATAGRSVGVAGRRDHPDAAR